MFMNQNQQRDLIKRYDRLSEEHENLKEMYKKCYNNYRRLLIAVRNILTILIQRGDD